MSVNEKMTAIADEIRVLSGTTGTMGLDAMATHVGDANTQVANQQDLITQIQTALRSKASGSSSEITLQNKTVTPSSEQQVVLADSGYTGLNSVTIAGDENLTAENIRSGTSIFGVSGTYVGTGGGQVSGVCPSLTIDGDSGISCSKIFYSSGGQYTELYDESANRTDLPVTLQNVDIDQPFIIMGLDYDSLGDLLIDSCTNLDVLWSDIGYTWSVICQCTSTEAATLTFVLDAGTWA